MLTVADKAGIKGVWDMLKLADKGVRGVLAPHFG